MSETEAQKAMYNFRDGATSADEAIVEVGMAIAHPDLLDACKSLIADFENTRSWRSAQGGDDYPDSKAIEQAKAAVAKAAGGSKVRSKVAHETYHTPVMEKCCGNCAHSLDHEHLCCPVQYEHCGITYVDRFGLCAVWEGAS